MDDFVDFLLSKSIDYNNQKPQFGFAKGMIKILPGFEDPIEV